MIRPTYLKEGDLVYVVSTARKIDKEVINEAKIILESWGFMVKLGEHLFSEKNQFAGSDRERSADFQSAIDDPKCKAIFCARGGYGTIRLLEHLNFSSLINQPKWVIGYSDVTVLHSHLQQVLGIESLHATMLINFKTNSGNSLQKLRNTLFGHGLSYNFSPHDFNKAGQCEGELIGGNLSILYSLEGSESFPDTKGKILFIEDLDEYLYHIDRMMISLKRAGCFDKLSGLVVGGMTEMNDNDVPFGKNAEEIIQDVLSVFDFPICFGFPAGHMDDNNPLIMGRKAELLVEEKGCGLKFNL